MAEANAKQLLKDQGVDPVAAFTNSSSSSAAAPASSATAVLGAFTTSQPWLTALRVRVEPVTVRAAFSNIPAWNLLLEEGSLLGLVSRAYLIVAQGYHCRNETCCMLVALELAATASLQNLDQNRVTA
jgi:hypothetical protein